MKKFALCCSLALACSGAWASDTAHSDDSPHAHDAAHAGGLEMGLAFGRDYGEHRNLVALSAAAPIGAGFKGVFEIAKGRGADVTEAGEVKHERGTTVLALKAAKELFSIGHAEFGLSAGVAHLSAETRSGTGLVAGAEAVYPVCPNLAAKVEASRFFGTGNIDDIRANVVQAGLVYSFH